MNEPTQQELNERAAGAVTSYGVGTRSYNRSAEKREIERQRKAATEKFEAEPRREVLLPLVCGCRSFPFAHSPARHRTLRDEFDWTPWQQRYSVVSGYLAEKEKQQYRELRFWERE